MSLFTGKYLACLIEGQLHGTSAVTSSHDAKVKEGFCCVRWWTQVTSGLPIWEINVVLRIVFPDISCISILT